jgi:hypothetical protein
LPAAAAVPFSLLFYYKFNAFSLSLLPPKQTGRKFYDTTPTSGKQLERRFELMTTISHA